MVILRISGIVSFISMHCLRFCKQPLNKFNAMFLIPQTIVLCTSTWYKNQDNKYTDNKSTRHKISWRSCR